MDDAVVISMRLGRIEDMFQSSDDVLSPHYRPEPGIDTCISELRSRRRTKGPVRLELELPHLDPDGQARLRGALTRSCTDRIARNDRERRIAKRDAYAALKIGIPLALLGLAIAVGTAVANEQDDLPNLAGWVLAWVGLWYPLDAILFSGLALKRENAVLARLQEAEVVFPPP